PDLTRCRLPAQWHSSILSETDAHATTWQDRKRETRAGPHVSGDPAGFGAVREAHEPCPANLAHVADTLEKLCSCPLPSEKLHHVTPAQVSRYPHSAMATTPILAATARVMFTAPGAQVNGLEAVPEGLWLCDQRDNRCYLVDYEGRLISSFAGPARNASGVTFGAGSVWAASIIRPSMIFRHDPTTGQCTACLVLEGEGGVHGLQWRPYEPGEVVPRAPESKPELHPTAPAGRLNGGPGISGRVVEAKWPGTREALHGFDPERLADLTPDDVDRLAEDSRLIRNRRKIEATVANAQTMLDLDREYKGFKRYLGSFADYDAT